MRYFIISLIWCAVFSTVKGQDLYQGYIVTNQQDTIFGTIKLGGMEQRQIDVVFIHPATLESTTFKPFQIKGYFADDIYYEAKVLATQSEFNYGYSVFMKKINDGEISVLEYWNMETARAFKQVFLYKDGLLTEVNPLKFKKQMVNYFQDNEAIQQKIYIGDYKKGNLMELVEAYNAWKQRQYLELSKN